MLITLWRTMILFIAVTCSLRFMGKRQIGELQPSELVTTIMVSNIAAILSVPCADPLSRQ